MSRPHTEVRFEEAIVGELLGCGWALGSTSNYRPELGLDTAELATFLGDERSAQYRQVKRLIDHYGTLEATQRELAKRIAAEIDKRGALDVLRHGLKDHGVTLQLAHFRPGQTLAAGALDEYHSNRLTVTRQLHYSAKDANKSLDLTFFLNGVPVATAELKNPLTGQTVEDAKRQYRTDRDPRELLFARRTLVHFAVDPDLVFITTRLAGDKTRFLPFNVGTNGPGVSGGAGNPPAADGYATSYLWQQVWQRDAWLELLQRFLHVQTSTGRRGRAASTDPHAVPMIFPRFHQWDAVRKMTTHAQAHGAGHNYLVEHSAGSGKSNTIAWLAHRLSTLHGADNRPVFDKAIVITDRVVLDRQLQDTIYQFDHVPGVVQRVDEDSAQLAAALEGPTARIIITTQQKFPYVLDKVAQLGSRRYAVIIDEAHSSQSGESAAALKKALGRHGSDDIDDIDDIDDDGDVLTASALARGKHPNLSYFAFTATPKSKTLSLFGTHNPMTDKEEPFHVYSMRQAIEEGFILDVLRNYITYTTRWRLTNAAVEAAEAARSAVADGTLFDPEVDPRKARAELVRAAELHPASLEARAKVIVDHFMKEVRWRIGGRAKAMVVTRSREHAARLYQAIRGYIEKRELTGCDTLVAFSGTLQLDGIDHTESKFNGFSESALPDAFAYTRADDPHAATRNQVEYRILVVAEKYQTGFDQPLLTAMYVDKALTGVAAVQTLSRLNRTHPLKTQEDVLVLDLANEAADIQAAFKPYFETTITEPTDPNLLYDKEREAMDFQLLVASEMQAFAEALLGASPTMGAKAHAALYRFTDPARDRFVALQGDDPERAESFRKSLGNYVRLYGFLAQIVGFADPDRERLYLYGRALLSRLPHPPSAGVDTGDTDLSHFRIFETGRSDQSLAPEGPVVIPGPSADGGARHDVEEVPLSQVIEELNKEFGLSLGTSDRIVLEQHIASLAENPDMVAVALQNDEERFAQVVEPELDRSMTELYDSNTRLVEKYFDEAECQRRYREIARRRAYDIIRSPARDEALRRLRDQASRP